MNNIIRVEDTKLYLAKNYIGANKSLGQCLDEVPTVNAIEIPDGATNGDVIKALFPKAMVYEAGIAMDVEFPGDEEHWFNKDWWNAPYKKGEVSE